MEFILAKDGAIYALRGPTVLERVTRSRAEWHVSLSATVFRPGRNGREELIGRDVYPIGRDTCEAALGWFRMNHYPRGHPISASEFDRLATEYSQSTATASCRRTDEQSTKGKP
jgi:hypothetical protein